MKLNIFLLITNSTWLASCTIFKVHHVLMYVRIPNSKAVLSDRLGQCKNFRNEDDSWCLSSCHLPHCQPIYNKLLVLTRHFMSIWKGKLLMAKQLKSKKTDSKEYLKILENNVLFHLLP